MRRALPFLLTALLLAPPALAAQEFTEGESDVRFDLRDDTYRAGDLLVIEEIVQDDVLAAGRSIIVRGDVGGDVQAAGQSIRIEGNVAGDVRLAGSDVELGGNIGSSAIVFAGSVYVPEGTTISGSLVIFAGSVTVDGTVQGNLHVEGDSIRINGRVLGSTIARGARIEANGSFTGEATLAAESLTLGDRATFASDSRYWRREGELQPTQRGTGTLTFDSSLQRVKPEWERKPANAFSAVAGALTLFSLFSAALTIGVLQFVTKTMFTESAKRLRRSPSASLLWGLLYFIVTPVVALLLFITLIGIPLSLALLFLYLLSLVFAKAITAMVLARWAEQQYRKTWHPVGVFFASLGVFAVLKLLMLVPVVGWLLVLLAVLFAFGAFLSVKTERIRKVA